jgi:general secretion pathway protein D
LGLAPTLCSATVPSAANHATWAATALGQAGSSPQTAARAKVASLIDEARTAMKAGDLGTAESRIGQAEQMNVRYGLFHLGDTPQKARRDLERQKKKSDGDLPSAKFSPQSSDTATDPFLDGGPSSTETSSAATPALPLQLNAGQAPGANDAGYGRVQLKEPAAAASAATGSPSPMQQINRAASDKALVAARRSLAVGDTRTARQHLQAAQAQRVQYGPYEDSPAKVDEAIKKHEDLAQRQGGQNTEAWRRQYAQQLIEQAEALIRWNELEEAERLASDASRMGAAFTQYERSPATILDQIAQARGSARQQSPALSQPGHSQPGLAQPGVAGPAIAQPAQSQSQSQSPIAASAQHPKKGEAVALMQQARQALAQNHIAMARQLADRAQALRIPDSEFAPGEDRPWQVALAVQSKLQAGEGVVQAGGIGQDRYAQSAVYNPAADNTRTTLAGVNLPTMPSTPNVRYAQAETPVEQPGFEAPGVGTPVIDTPLAAQENLSPGVRLFQQGEAALRAGDKAGALAAFRDAAQFQQDLDPGSQQRLQDHLQLLGAPRPFAGTGEGPAPLIDSASQGQQLLARQLSAEVARQQSEARRLREKDPTGALTMLKTARTKIETSGLEPTSRAQLIRRIDLSIGELERYIDQNRGQIALDDRNKEILDDIDRRRAAKVEMQQKVADMVEQFNNMIDEHRYEEAEVVARRAYELAPQEPVVQQLWQQTKFIRRERNITQMREASERGVWDTLHSVDVAAIPFDDSQPFRHGDAREWEALTTSRAGYGKEGRTRMTERELEIQRKLKTPVSVQFQDRPLAEVIDQLARLTGVNVHLDPRGLAEEGVTSATPVTLSLTNEISLRSALNLILEPLHLSYVIKDEVLKITSEQLRDGEVYTHTYNVADLVIPIPNFVPGNNLGLSGLLNEAYAGVGYGTSAPPLAAMAGPNGASGTGMINPQVMAQMNQATGGFGGGGGGMGGPGGLGGGAQADFDALIELITATIQPNTWDEVGGPGSVREFATNLSLVVSQTQDVHEEIVDLLEQLRRLQDLQVTIEVRFITLTDGFFEQIGVDFDFNIVNNDPRGTAANLDVGAGRVSPSTTVGVALGPPVNGFNNPTITANLDVPFAQDSITLAGSPVIAGVNPADFAQVGFAILSDIEAYFLIRAAQSDSRSNVLEAPKVTLFNGQQAFVSDTQQRPFVISVIPVVGDFAAAQQPVIVVLSEGTFLSLQAVVSPDRRYVRLTIVPFFSQIGDVETFQFEGSTTSTSSMSQGLDDNDNVVNSADAATTIRSGTTVQLPTFIFTTVTTTVSVPDGGTVLLGGIKRLTEARNEAGIPLLSKVPYVNRLFKNVGITRFTQSLLMMVTPRIIIQEEEEEKLGIESF